MDLPGRAIAVGRRMALPLVFLALYTASALAQAGEDDITAELWAGSGDIAGFYWEFWPHGSGLRGAVYWVSDGRMETEQPVDRITWSPPDLEMRMAATGVWYRGTVDFPAGVIRGRLFYGEEEGPEANLRLTDPERVPALRARPPGAPEYAYTQPAAMADGWDTADCQDVGLSHEAVANLVSAIERGDAGVIHSLLVIVEGKLVVEEYFHGYGREDEHRLASATKSVSSLLVGLAVDQGFIPGVEAPVLGFFPALDLPLDEFWRSETLYHLLTMSMGLDWASENGPHGTGPEFFQRVLDRRVVHEPGTVWAYHSPNVDLLAGVIREATGQHADAFAEEYLFGPLGITTYDWSFLATDGYPLMDGSLHLRPRDMAKLGALLRNEGRWRDRQVVSADWIRQSVIPHMETSGPERYGYLWWLGDFAGPAGTQPAVYASGWGSQFIAWLPESDTILVVTGGNEDNSKNFAILRVLGQLF